MRKTLQIIFFLFITTSLFVNTAKAQWYENNSPFPTVINYKMDIELNYEQKMLSSSCKVKIKNPSDRPIDNIPLLLYRLMKVNSITDNKKNELPFKQRILSFNDFERMQANFINIPLKEPLLPKETFEFEIKYSGYLFGYTETGMNYIKDNISSDFTILRNDCLAFPEIGIANEETYLSLELPSFNYLVNITVPDTLNVVCGGKFLNKKHTGGKATYTYKSIQPSWRMDIAIGDYKTLKKDEFTVYYMNKDSVESENIVKAWHKIKNLYTDWWGPLVNSKGFSVIGLPAGYGSQADASCILQDLSRLKNPEAIHGFYHEVSHLWNVSSTDKYSPRWNEGLARFVQYLALIKLDGIDYLKDITNWSIGEICKKESYANTALIDFGKEGITGKSYVMGMVLFYVFYELVGEEEFHNVIKEFYKDYNEKGANTKEFLDFANKKTTINLDTFFNDWFYTTNYVSLLKKGYSIDKLVEHYEK